MSKYFYIFIICFLMTKVTFSQQLSHVDSLSRLKAENVVEKHLKSFIGNDSYVLYSIDDKWYLIVVEKLNSYEEYYVHEDTLKTIGKKECFKHRKKASQILSIAFNSDLYHKGFINLNSDFYRAGYELSQGNTTYFYLKDKDGNLYGESKLTTIIIPNPINEKVYSYLLTRLLCYVNSNK